MDTYIFETDITVYCLTATSFPAGVAEVYNQLHATYPPGNGRTYYGISYPDGKGALVYKAAVCFNETDVPPSHPFESFTIKKGTYNSTIILNFMSDVQSIGRTFQQMIKDPNIDPNGYCLEMYLNPNDVMCMVRVGSESNEPLQFLNRNIGIIEYLP